jgi:GWxTD domain-containing protein
VLAIDDELGERRFESKGGWRYEAENLPLHFRIPLDALEAGQYALTISPSGAGVAADPVRVPLRLLSSEAPRPAELDRRAVEAQLFLTGAGYADWQRLPAGERVAMMRRFWRSQDPNPATRENEVYDEFRRRYELAQERYTGFRPGALTDRGRILIRYGEPDEIRAEVMPENRAALINAIRDLHGKQAVPPGLSPWTPDMAEGQEDQDPELNRDLESIGHGNSLTFGNESEPFEVWSYQLGGRPLLPRYRLNLRRPALKLIFADRKGYGDYELLYRSEDFDF